MLRLNKPTPYYISLCVSLAFVAGILVSWPLWIYTPEFPDAPVFPTDEIFQPPFDRIILIAFILLLSLFTFLKNRTWYLWTFLLLAFLLLAGDQNRWQPWVFEYVLILGAGLMYKNDDKKNMFAVRIILSGIYLWSGLQKFNENYFVDTAYWIMEPWDNFFGWKHRAGIVAWIIPPLEVVVGIGILFQRTRRISAWILVCMHLFIMFNMGILKDYNWVIQPWNICNILLLYLLFIRDHNWEFDAFKKQLRSSVVLKLLFVLVFIMPAFSLFNKWDSYLSSRLYSGNSSNGYAFISENLKNSLPDHLSKLVQYKDSNAYIYINNWAMEDLHIPCYPEKRVYMKAVERIRSYTSYPEECVLLITDQFNLADTTDVEVVK